MSSPRAAGLSHRRSSSRGSRADLPSIEEAPFQQGSIRSDSAYPLEQGSSRHARGDTVGDGNHTLRRNNSQKERTHQTYRTGKDHQYPDQTFMEASALQPAIRITQSGDDGRRSTFRQLVPRASTSAPTSDCEQHQGHFHHISPPVQHQRPFHPVSARPSTAQAGSMVSSQRFGQQSMISRPATAQSVRHAGTNGGSRSLLPTAIPSSAHRPSNSMIRSGARFHYQPDG